jgi:hypothetical protein
MGISSFASPGNVYEIKEGLEKLKTDMTLKNFEMVKSKFENKSGDYLFVVFKKETSAE